MLDYDQKTELLEKEAQKLLKIRRWLRKQEENPKVKKKLIELI